MKNERTPRTLADTEFRTGYPENRPRRGLGWTDAIYVVVVLVCAAGIGAMLAMGV
jgi:hypothetical protein